MQATTIQATAATQSNASALEGKSTARLIAFAGLNYLAAEILYLYARRHVPYCGCMPTRLILPDGEPRLLIGTVLFWIVSGVLLGLALVRVGRGLLGAHPLKWACSLLPWGQAAALHADLTKHLHDPGKRPSAPTRAYATDALIFLAAAMAILAVSAVVAVAAAPRAPRAPDDQAFVMTGVGCVAASILALESLRRGLLFLYAWRRVILASANAVTIHLGNAFFPLGQARLNRKRPAWCFTRRQLLKHAFWSVVLIPVAHAVLLLGALQFPPNAAGYWRHWNLIVMDSLDAGSVTVHRMGVDRTGTVAITWNEIYAYAEDPDCGDQHFIAAFLWNGPRWYFRKAWDISVGLSEKSAHALGWTRTKMDELVVRIEADLAALATTEAVTGDEFAERVAALDKRFVFKPPREHYSISCNGLDCNTPISGTGLYRYRLTKDALMFDRKGYAAWIDCKAGLTACIYTREATPTGALTGWQASLPFALFLVWVMLWLALAPCYYIKWRERT